MTSPKGLDIKFSGKDFEDVEEWCERMFMVVAIREYTEEKLMYAARLNLEGRAKDWFKYLEHKPVNWEEFQDLLKEKYGKVDALEIKLKLDHIKQEERQRVQTYFERLEKWFRRGKITDLEQRKRFVNGLRPEIRRLCFGKPFSDIDDAVATATKIETRLGQLGETPCDPLPDEIDDPTQARNEEAKRHIAHFSQTLVEIMRANAAVVPDKKIGVQMRALYLCRRCYRENHCALECPDKDKACEKCGRMGHRTIACGVKCSKCGWSGHFDHECQNQVPGSSSNLSDARLVERIEVVDEAEYLDDLEREMGMQDLFVGQRLPRNRAPTVDHVRGPVIRRLKPGEAVKNVTEKSLMLSHFRKRRVTMSPLECAMRVPGELKFLENLVTSIKKRLQEENTRQVVTSPAEVAAATVAMVNGTDEENQSRTDPDTTSRPIRYVKGTDRRLKSLLLTVGISGTYVNGQMDTGASMSIMSEDTARELGLLKEVIGEESYRTASGAVEKALGRLEQVPVMVADVRILQDFMMIRTTSYKMLLGIDFLFKVGAVLDFEQALIQIRKGPGTNMQVLKLHEIHMATRECSDDSQEDTSQSDTSEEEM